MSDLAININSFANFFGAYGIPALIVLVVIDGSIMAITSGVLIAAGSVPAVLALIIYSVSDWIISTFYFLIGREGNNFFGKIKNKILPNESYRATKLHKTVSWLQRSYKKHFYLTYALFRFLPIPYTTLAANVASGGTIKKTRFYSYLAWLVPAQGLIYIALGYMIGQGLLFESSPLRIMGLVFALASLAIVVLLKPKINKWYQSINN